MIETHDTPSQFLRAFDFEGLPRRQNGGRDGRN